MPENPEVTQRTVEQIEEMNARAGKFLPYQWNFIFAPEQEVVLASGFGSGKSHACTYKGLVLSKIFPGNRGLIGRFHGSDLDDSVIPLFFEICPPTWIRHYNKQKNIVTLKNNSQILFRHIHDPGASGTKSRRVGANLGWFFIDQLEECQEAHWNGMLGRLRLPAAKRRFAFGTMNPNGHDWIYRRFFRGVGKLPVDRHVEIREENRLGIAVVSEVNRKSRGGFVDDSYFDSLLRTYTADWIARWVYCSFDDFSGKIYKEYELGSVHNVEPFPIPSYWPHIVSIDVGGQHPWAILDNVVDDHGNTITIQEFFKSSVNINEISAWIKNHTPWSDAKTTFVIDWENRQAAIELQEHGIVCRPAMKKVQAGILRVGGYLHVDKEIPLPKWYYETQTKTMIEKFESGGSPRDFVFAENCPNYCRQMDAYIWDPNNPAKPKKENDDCCDSKRYALAQRPEAAELPKIDKYRKLRETDPLAAREWEQFDRRVAARQMVNSGGALLEMDSEGTHREGEPEMEEVLTGRKNYEFEGDV